MKKFIAFVTLLVLFAGYASFLSYPPQSKTILEQPDIIVEVLDPSLEPYAPMWRDEISRRFHYSVGILVHGGQLEAGRWVVGTVMYGERRLVPMDEIIQYEQKRWPGRIIVVLACNVEHTAIRGYSGVFYAPSSVWCIPDRCLTPELIQDGADRITLGSSRWQDFPEVTGNIYEFIPAY